MPASVYIETSVISYYTARSSRDLVAAARQTITQEWWEEARDRFELYVSTVVIAEAKTGDPHAAQRRMAAISDLPVLAVNEAAKELAKQLIAQKLIPETSAEDALHIALATVHNMNFLLTWNFRHINNAETKTRITAAIESLGYECPLLCSPEELGGTEP
ncbi:MAG TPA: type II toxin-antitoxin system VapC family toxin [Candidatus Competibacteraceae bacterium]|nr:type II toxin-antitoxin system VapC family toxin [Candidatus Competibacteraceae bacterium]HRZ05611.1 type II toxin-antitoxin system VapC family toxin [Candidatus Competibacteraceae bacterium]HSA46520.1 type II toxin-antitoxin system VapC family toxin [Candidatus Competibacteraceae bacterium]